MLGRPTAAVARHSLCPRISPFPRRQTPHHRRLLISCSGSPWESRETSQQMGFHLVTLPTARSDYMASSSGALRPKLPGVVSVGSLSSKTWTHAKTGNWARVVCSFCPKEGGWEIHWAKWRPISCVESRAWILCSCFTVLITRSDNYSARFKINNANDRNLHGVIGHVCLSKCYLLQENPRD